MSSTQPMPPQDLARQRAEEFAKMKRYAAIAFIVATPVLIAMPPRKLDLYTVSLCGAFCISANHLTADRTGMSIGEHISTRMMPNAMKQLPSERAEQVQAQLRAQREAQMRNPNITPEEYEKLKKRTEQSKGTLERIWMGGESEDWKRRRMAEEAKALEQGKGYWDLITDYFKDAWHWNETREDTKTEKK
ncbi:hypothetical protein KEM56_006642 [Ascosphaera pollenicola]|nr:hypothetical protein KEM56_006642 [Ascosphaera pollenicola]